MPAMVATETAEEKAEPLPVLETAFMPPPAPPAEGPRIRFAEDVLVSVPTKPEAKPKKKRKKDTHGRKGAEDGINLKKLRREPEIPAGDEDEEY